MRNFDRDFERAQNTHTWMMRFFIGWFVVVALFIFLVWGALGYVVFNVANDPSIVGRTAGEIVRGFEDTRKDP